MPSAPREQEHRLAPALNPRRIHHTSSGKVRLLADFEQRENRILSREMACQPASGKNLCAGEAAPSLTNEAQGQSSFDPHVPGLAFFVAN